MFGMLLLDSAYKGEASYVCVIRLARESRGPDMGGHRAESLRLIQSRRGQEHVATTLAIYSHLLPSAQQDAADKMNAVFNPGPEPGRTETA